ncbi:MAG TPA: hypothetical protein VK968_16155 [Roseimicrobium sp.]|nr:hypothetical protein [Roseimicrobium sp.]
MKLRPFHILPAACLLWALLAGAGFAWIGRYEHRPGSSPAAPEVWPAGSWIEHAPDRPTLLMFAHPRCPCTRASLEELARLMARCGDRTRATVVFFQPKGAGEDWKQTDLWRTASSIPGVNVQTDTDGIEARRFHGETSGQVLLYDTAGALVFAGGITGSRGHEGDNAGRSALQAVLNEGRSIQVSTPVFGCSLLNPDPQCKPTNPAPRL